MRYTPEQIARAQGWLGNQINETAKAEEDDVVSKEVLTHWKILDEAIDDFQREHAAMYEKLRVIALENITK